MSDLPKTWKGQHTVRGYVCSISWETEIGEASDGVVIYSTLDDIHRVEGCANPTAKNGCGVYEVEVTIKRVAVPEPEHT